MIHTWLCVQAAISLSGNEASQEYTSQVGSDPRVESGPTRLRVYWHHLIDIHCEICTACQNLVYKYADTHDNGGQNTEFGIDKEINGHLA